MIYPCDSHEWQTVKIEKKILQFHFLKYESDLAALSRSDAPVNQVSFEQLNGHNLRFCTHTKKLELHSMS